MAATEDISPIKRSVAINLAADTNVGDARCVYVGTTGDVVVDEVGNATPQQTWKNHPVGYMLVQVTKIYSTANGTTAANLRACY